MAGLGDVLRRLAEREPHLRLRSRLFGQNGERRLFAVERVDSLNEVVPQLPDICWRGGKAKREGMLQPQ